MRPPVWQSRNQAGGGESPTNRVTAFTDFDINGYEAYQMIEVPRGTELESLGLPETISVVLEGSEEAADIPVTWECIDDSFGGNTYQPNHENESAVYTFMARLGEGYVLSEELQAGIDAGAVLPWIEVRYEGVEASEDMKAGLVADPYYTERKTVGNGKLWYTTECGKAFNIKGENPVVKTTYRDLGYEMTLVVGDIENSNPTENGNVKGIANGTVEEIEGVQVQPLIDFTADGAYVKVRYKVCNITNTAKVVSLCGGADVMIGQDDSATINRQQTGLTMAERTTYENSMDDGVISQFNLYCERTFGTTPVDTLWFGKYDDREDNYWNKTDKTELKGTDSGIAFSWQNRTLAPGATTEFSLLFGVGDPVDPPVIDMEAELALDYTAERANVKALVQDADNRTYKVYYSLDDGDEQVLSANEYEHEGDIHFSTENSKQTWGTEPIHATGSKQGIGGKILIPPEWEAGSVHKLQVWVKNDLYAMSDVKIVYIIKKKNESGGEVVVPAKEYTITFDANGGVGTPPGAITAFEGTDVILPMTGLTKEGYTHTGWSPDNGTTTYGPGAVYKMASEDATMKAVYTPLPITAGEAPVITGTYGTAISEAALSASGGTGSYAYALEEGSTLPAGLSLSTDGKITGTPTDVTSDANGTIVQANVVVVITDAGNGATASVTVPITIDKNALTVSGAVNTEKVYDAGKAIDVGNLTLTGLVADTDKVTASATAGAFADANVSMDSSGNVSTKMIALSGITLSGEDAGKYSIAETAEISGKITPRPITVKPVNEEKKVGEALPEAHSFEEVLSGGQSALQGTDSLDLLGTPEYAYTDYKDEAGAYPITLSFINANPNYAITCEEGTITVSQDVPTTGENGNYQIAGTKGPFNNDWYISKIIVTPTGGYDQFVEETNATAEITVENQETTKTVQLKNSTTGAVTSEISLTLKSDTIAPAVGEISVTPKESSILADIGRTLTFGHFFKEEVEVSVNLSDAVSGLKEFAYKLPGKTEFEKADVSGKTGTAKFTIPLNTDGQIQIQATDVAGNTLQGLSLTKDGMDIWVVENTAPTISEFTTKAESRKGWYKTDVSLTAKVTDRKETDADKTSGLNQVKQTVNGKEKVLFENPADRVMSYDFAETFTENGKNELTLRAEDNAANISEKEMIVQIDKELPVVDKVTGNPEKEQYEEAKISFTLKDEISGIDPDVEVQVLKDGKEKIAVECKDGVYTFTTKGNGTYVIKAMDLAGNELETGKDRIVVNMLRVKPKAVKTGDPFPAGAYILFCMLAFAGTGLLIWRENRDRENRRGRRY